MADETEWMSPHDWQRSRSEWGGPELVAAPGTPPEWLAQTLNLMTPAERDAYYAELRRYEAQHQKTTAAPDMAKGIDDGR